MPERAGFVHGVVRHRTLRYGEAQCQLGLFHLECISTCDPETNAVLCSILEMMKEQFVYSHRLHGWIIAVAETLEKHPDLAAELLRHPFYDQGPAPFLQTSDVRLQNIDALIRQLSEKK